MQTTIISSALRQPQSVYEAAAFSNPNKHNEIYITTCMLFKLAILWY